MFFHDALIWLAVALDAILQFAIAFRKLSQNLIGPFDSVTKPKDSVETDHVPDLETMDTDGIYAICPHDGTSIAVVHSLPQAPQRQSCLVVNAACHLSCYAFVSQS